MYELNGCRKSRILPISWVHSICKRTYEWKIRHFWILDPSCWIYRVSSIEFQVSSIKSILFPPENGNGTKVKLSIKSPLSLSWICRDLVTASWESFIGHTRIFPTMIPAKTSSYHSLRMGEWLWPGLIPQYSQNRISLTWQSYPSDEKKRNQKNWITEPSEQLCSFTKCWPREEILSWQVDIFSCSKGTVRFTENPLQEVTLDSNGKPKKPGGQGVFEIEASEHGDM